MMKLNRFILMAIVAVNLGMLSNAYALDLYVDTTTKQIYAEPGPGRAYGDVCESREHASQKRTT